MGCFSSDTKPKTTPTYGFSKQEELQEALHFALNKGEDENLSMQLELHFACANLKNMDTFSLTDSACVVYLKDKRDGEFKKVGQTEVITDNLNPVFVKSILIDYLFEETQEVKVTVFDIDDFTPNANVEQTVIGSVQFFLHDLVRTQGQPLTLPLNNGTSEKLGDVVITGSERKKASRSTYRIILEGIGFTTQNLFYRFYKLLDSGQYAPIFESETAKKLPHEPVHRFQEAVVHSAALIQDDESRKAMIEVFEWNSSGTHKSLGKKEFLITEMLEGIPMKFATGEIRTLKCEKQELYSFLDYVYNGLEIALMIAVDFTLSNKDPSNPSSLHYFDLYKNQYLQAITSVGQILENYDSDKKFPVFGFGARVPFLLDKTSHCFALNGDIFHPEVNGIQGVIETYKNTLKAVKLNGPTFFSQIINYVNNMVEYEVKVCKYLLDFS